MSSPLAFVFDIQVTAAGWKPARGDEGRTQPYDPILVPRRGLGGLLREMWREGKPVVFLTDADRREILPPLNDALHRLGLDDMDYHFISTFTHGRAEGKNFKPVVDKLGFPPSNIVYFGDTAASPMDLLSAQDFGIPFVHIPATYRYHRVPFCIMEHTGFHELPMRKHLSKGFEGVLDFQYGTGGWQPMVLRYDEALARYYGSIPTGNAPPSVPKAYDAPIVRKMRVH